MGSLVRLVAIVASGLVLLGFAYFATDEMGRGSQHQQNALANELAGLDDPAPIAPSNELEAEREKVNGPMREFVEDTNDLLLGPFTGIVEGSNDRWVRHSVPAILALMLYGLGLGMLANMLPKSREHGADWRAAT
jgi:hypothetical protein